MQRGAGFNHTSQLTTVKRELVNQHFEEKTNLERVYLPHNPLEVISRTCITDENQKHRSITALS